MVNAIQCRSMFIIVTLTTIFHFALFTAAYHEDILISKAKGASFGDSQCPTVTACILNACIWEVSWSECVGKLWLQGWDDHWPVQTGLARLGRLLLAHVFLAQTAADAVIWKAMRWPHNPLVFCSSHAFVDCLLSQRCKGPTFITLSLCSNDKH